MSRAIEIIALARATMRDDPRAATEMLLAGRPTLPDVPRAYDVMICKAALAAGEVECAIDHIAPIANLGAGVSAETHLLLADALIRAGSYAEAADAVWRALRSGASIDELSMRQRIVIEDHPSQASGRDNSARPFDVVCRESASIADQAHRVVLTPCPKNACTVMKATLVMNSPARDQYKASGQTIHAFCDAHKSGSLSPSKLGQSDAVFRFTIVRDPLRRVLSAYLNKFVGGSLQSKKLIADVRGTIRGAQSLLGLPYDPDRSISFEEFCQYLASISDAGMNGHWIPQVRFTGSDPSAFDHIGKFEVLEETFQILTDRFGYAPELNAADHIIAPRGNVTRFDKGLRLVSAHRRLPSQLLRLKRTGFPMPEHFLTPDICDILAKVYARDFDFIGRALAPHTANG